MNLNTRHRSLGNEVDLLIRGLERFQALGVRRVTSGAVLYNGEQQFNVRGVRSFNPLLVEDVWETLIAPNEPKKR